MSRPHYNTLGHYFCPRCNGKMLYRATDHTNVCLSCNMQFDAGMMRTEQAIWVQGNGNPVFVKDMETTHIQYSINKILNDLPRRTFMLPHLVAELKKRLPQEENV